MYRDINKMSIQKLTNQQALEKMIREQKINEMMDQAFHRQVPPNNPRRLRSPYFIVEDQPITPYFTTTTTNTSTSYGPELQGHMFTTDTPTVASPMRVEATINAGDYLGEEEMRAFRERMIGLWNGRR
jgi:predicted GTPase